MRFLDALLGRSKPVRPNLDQLFALPSAAITLQAGADLVPTGLGSVCFASAEGGAFKQLQRDVRELLDSDTDLGGIPVEFSQDEYGYTWMLARHTPDDLASLVNDLHAVNTLLADGGFGPQLLCSLVGFRSVGAQGPSASADVGAADDEGAAGTATGGSGTRSLALVYLYKRGAFYPFAPLPGANEKRDSAEELEIRGLLDEDLTMEPDLSRWFPVWGAPGL